VASRYGKVIENSLLVPSPVYEFWVVAIYLGGGGAYLPKVDQFIINLIDTSLICATKIFSR